jgi:hypothetical protein
MAETTTRLRRIIPRISAPKTPLVAGMPDDRNGMGKDPAPKMTSGCPTPPFFSILLTIRYQWASIFRAFSGILARN